LACAGDNGQVYVRDPGDGGWTQSHVDNVGIRAGLSPFAASFNGNGWVVGTNVGVFRSATGVSPWTRVDLRQGVIDWTAFAVQDHRLFGAFDLPAGALILESGDDGASWGNGEFFPNAVVQAFAISGGFLYAARGDGVFRRPVIAAAGAPPPGSASDGLDFAVAGAQPFQGGTRVRFTLPAAGRATLTVYDVQGRAVRTSFDESLPA